MANNPQAPRHERQRYRIDQLMEPSNKAKLKGEARLHAALFVGKLFDRALATGKSRESIEARIGARLGEIGVASRDFRAERWRLPKSVTEINAEVKLEWDRKAEPQRKESVYYHVVHVLCELLGEDPLAAQIALRELIVGGASDSGSRAEDIDPAHRVASLVRHMTKAFAVEQDLVALWTEARKLNTGSDLLRGPVIVPVSERHGGHSWRGGCVMSAPCPSVHLVRVPLMTANTTFDVRPIDGEARGSSCVEGVFKLFFDIHLLLEPNELDGAIPKLGLVFCHELSLNEVGAFGGFDGLASTTQGHQEITSLGEFSSNAVDIATPDGQRWLVEASSDWDWDDLTGAEVFSSGFGFCAWDAGAEDFFALAELAPGCVPVDANTLRRWLAFMPDGGLLPPGATWTLGSADHAGRSISGSSSAKAHDRPTPVEPWSRKPGMQQNLERALHQQTIEAALQAWVMQYRTALHAEAEQWCQRAKESEARLRARWQETIRNVTGLHSVDLEQKKDLR